MGYPVASDDLFLLAVAELTEGAPARDVLESKGISVERLATQISSRALPMPAESSGLMFPPAYKSMAGRAEAFAASLGDGPISPEHVLMALISDPSSLRHSSSGGSASAGRTSSTGSAHEAWPSQARPSRLRSRSKWARGYGSTGKKFSA
jgi:hypothetical protein